MSCDCLQCKLRRLALAESLDSGDAIKELTIVIGRMLADFDEAAMESVVVGLHESRAFYRQKRAGDDAIGEVSGHA